MAEKHSKIVLECARPGCTGWVGSIFVDEEPLEEVAKSAGWRRIGQDSFTCPQHWLILTDHGDPASPRWNDEA